MRNVASTLDEATYFDGFTPFTYMVRESGGYEDQMDMSQDTTFSYHCKAVDKL